tara:strand:+ start:273 stop:929 length:657 start_codon:yes stop_codon:yes gene_type:complete
MKNTELDEEELERDNDGQVSLNQSKFLTNPPHRDDKPTNLKLKVFGLALLLIAGTYGTFNFHAPEEKVYPTVSRNLSSVKKLILSKDIKNISLTKSIQNELAKGKVPEVIKNADPIIVQKIKSGEMSFYTLKVVDTIAQDGDIVKVFINGMPFSIITLTHIGADISIPLFTENTNTLQIQAIQDGGGGVTFGAYSNLGQVYTKIMNVGDIETWHIGGI